MEANAKAPPDHADLARELRQSLDALGSVVEDANSLVCDVEDAAGLSFPSTDVKPDQSEVDRAKAQISTTLAALAEMENRMRRQIWLFEQARRRLARMHP
jgi:hypothetical protein